MARNWHYLRASRSVGWPISQCVLSLKLWTGHTDETTALRLPVVLESWNAVGWRDKGAGPYQEVTASGRTAAELWRFFGVLMRKGERLWVWCRGMAHALSVIGGWQVISGGSITLCIVSDPPTIIDTSIPGLKGSIRFLDSRNVGIDPPVTTGADKANALDLSVHIQQYQQLVRSLELGGLRCTVAAQAWHGWRHRFLTCPVEIHNDVRRLNAEKEACFGGRNEVNRVGLSNGPIYEIDAQAHYPAVAVDHSLPARTVRPADCRGITAEEATAQGMLVIARGRVHTETPCVPCNRAGRVVFPVGSWPAVYCWPEVELIRREGGEFRVKEFWAYEQCAPLDAYMRATWRARISAERSGMGHGVSACKLLANSIVGRIGAIGRTWDYVPEAFHPEPWYTWWERHPRDGVQARWRTISGRVEVETISGWGDESIPAVAAWIYSLGRVRLHKWMRIAGFDNVFYCDTDSLWTNAEGKRRIETAGELRPGELGGLRVKKVHAWARFYGHKHYDSPAGVKWAGRPKNFVADHDAHWTYYYSESPGRAARAKRAPVTELLRVEVPNGTTYKGGLVGPGGEVFPHWVYEDEQV